MRNNKPTLNSEKPYSEFLLLLFVVLFIIVFAILLHIRDHNGIRNVCARTPEACSEAIYPGKVVE